MVSINPGDRFVVLDAYERPVLWRANYDGSLSRVDEKASHGHSRGVKCGKGCPAYDTGSELYLLTGYERIEYEKEWDRRFKAARDAQAEEKPEGRTEEYERDT